MGPEVESPCSTCVHPRPLSVKAAKHPDFIKAVFCEALVNGNAFPEVKLTMAINKRPGVSEA